MLNIKYRRKERNIDVKLIVRRACLMIMDTGLIALASYLALLIRFEFGEIDKPFTENVTAWLCGGYSARNYFDRQGYNSKAPLKYTKNKRRLHILYGDFR